MQKFLRESKGLVSRHALSELLPTRAINVELARRRHLDKLADIASREIPGVAVGGSDLARFLHNDPESIFVFHQQARVLGGAAFLYLNERGHDALILDNIDLKNPAVEFLARADEQVSAIYFWAFAASGRAVLGLGNIVAYQTRPRFSSADYFAQPATPAGRRLIATLCFQPTPSFQRDLWTYPRTPPMCSAVTSAPELGVDNHAHA